MPMAPPPQLKASMFGRMPVGGGKQKTKGGGGGYAGPKGVRIEHRIGVQAPAETIWGLIYDIARWSEWNPLYAGAHGTIRIGGKPDLTLVLPGLKPQKTRATVLEWVPNEQLHYQTAGMGGLIRGTHYVEIEQLAEASCIVANGEIVGGLLGPSVARSVGPKIWRAIKGMNEALKEQAEARWGAAG